VGGRISVQQEKISRAEHSWTHPLNALKTLKTVLAIINKLYCRNNSIEFLPGGRIYNLCTDVVAMTARYSTKVKIPVTYFNELLAHSDRERLYVCYHYGTINIVHLI
jgi:hypothetical protein